MADRSTGWRRAIFKRDRYRCTYCGCEVHRRDPRHPKYATIDHIVPLSKGGMSIDSNVTTACRECNGKKGNKMPAQVPA